ncbi:MAG: Gfo/Idh/MocA family oxidoreductase [Planctomycetaceae bacterium]|nr:Gfo/Idh/MocA family oxidoreductase [Planctomycetaceae bacterium]
MSKRSLSRRSFLAATSLVAAPVIVPQSVFGDDTKAAPSERITVGHIGVGNEGGTLFRAMQQVKEAQSVAVSDCYKSRRDGHANACKGKAYLDYHEIIDRSDIDCVVIATPDHWHVPQAIGAAKAKKGAYVEKPLGLSLAQILQIEKVFTDNGVQFQYGTQQRSQEHCWRGAALVRQGVIGKIVKIEVDAPNGHGGGATAAAPIPPDLGERGYETWNGPTLLRPYTVDRCKPDGTYMIYDYSIGYLGGWGAHPLDIMVWGSDADLSGTVSVEGTGTIKADELCNTVFNWNMKIKLGEVDLVFKTGGDRTRFIGEGGDWIEVRRSGIKASKPELLQVPVTENNGSALAKDTGGWGGAVHYNHHRDFILGVKNKTTPVSTLRDAVRSDTISHLSDIAVRTASVVKWNPQERTLIEATDGQKAIFYRR